MLNKCKVVAVRVLDVHFPVTPGLVGRLEGDRDALRDEFRVQGVHIIDDQEGPSRPGHFVTGE